MRRITLMTVALIAGAALIPALQPAPASALQLPALQQHTNAADAGMVQHVRSGGHGFRGHAFRGGGRRGCEGERPRRSTFALRNGRLSGARAEGRL